ncbi:MAG: hypothetical protein NXI01_06810 [Gammaproteobacteria bacterium]|nr:hypothetical protein [Gammaproteobacteria bacterium]
MSATMMDRHSGTADRALLTGLTPAHVAADDILKKVNYLAKTSTDTDHSPLRFDNITLFETDACRAEILRNVQTLLTKYDGDVTITRAYQREKIEKELLWAAVQLYARMQAIEQEVGLILEPNKEYLACQKQFNLCRDLLAKNKSCHLKKIDQMLLNVPDFLDNVEEDAQSENSFAWYVKQMDRFNEKRLYWVFTKPTIELALESLGETTANNHLSHATYLPGQVSWSLYLLRGTLFFHKYMQKRFSDPKWLKEMDECSPEERATWYANYHKAYWDVYKYRILNDFVWGPINLACFDWWFGDGFYGWLGEASTVFILFMDTSLSFLSNKERSAEDAYLQEGYLSRLHVLTEEIKVGSSKYDVKGTFENLAPAIQKEHADLLAKMIHNEVLSAKEYNRFSLLDDWMTVYQFQQDHQKAQQDRSFRLKVNCFYSVALLFSFSLCVSMLISGWLPASLTIILGGVGTLLCIGLTIAYRTINAQLNISAKEEARRALQEQQTAEFAEFIMLRQQAGSNPEGNTLLRMQELYLSLMIIGAQINHDEASIQYLYLELARTMLLRIVVPAVIALAYVYLPVTLLLVPVYLYVFAGSAGLAFGLDYWAKLYKPTEEITESKQLDKDAFDSFCKQPQVFGDYVDASMFSTLKRVSSETGIADLRVSPLMWEGQN